jgi:DNA polymerase-3 subunit epsilon
MREIVVDTETTGFDPATGDRIVEIGCVELFDHLETGKHFHAYLNPERLVPLETQKVHGLTDEFLADKPLFAHIVEEMIEFLGDAPLIIHNASFDLRFLNSELHRVGKKPIPMSRAIDTIEIAKAKIPGARYSLDELCKRFGIDLSARSKHGALLDAGLTARVYLELVGGRQTKLVLAPGDSDMIVVETTEIVARIRPRTLAARITEIEIQAHTEFVTRELGHEPLWKLAEKAN